MSNLKNYYDGSINDIFDSLYMFKAADAIDESKKGRDFRGDLIEWLHALELFKMSEVSYNMASKLIILF